MKVPRHYWDNIDNQRKFLEDIAEKLKIKTMEDWYKITPKQLEIACAPYPFRRTSGNLVPMLLRVYSGAFVVQLVNEKSIPGILGGLPTFLKIIGMTKKI